MPDEHLLQAVELIRSGRPLEARKLLERLIEADQQNVPAWMWYLETFSDVSERLRVLDVCERFNLGDTYVQTARIVLTGENTHEVVGSEEISRLPEQSPSLPVEDAGNSDWLTGLPEKDESETESEVVSFLEQVKPETLEAEEESDLAWLKDLLDAEPDDEHLPASIFELETETDLLRVEELGSSEKVDDAPPSEGEPEPAVEPLLVESETSPVESEPELLPAEVLDGDVGEQVEQEIILDRQAQVEPETLGETVWPEDFLTAEIPDDVEPVLEQAAGGMPGAGQLELPGMEMPEKDTEQKKETTAQQSDAQAEADVETEGPTLDELFHTTEPLGDFIPLPDSWPETSPLAKTFPWYKIWWTVLSCQPVQAIESLLDSPKAMPRRAYFWVELTAILSGIILAFIHVSRIEGWLGNPKVQLLLSITSFDFINLLQAVILVMIPLSVIFNTAFLLISAAFQNLLSTLFGGKGSYIRTVYLLGAMLAPLGLLSSILSFFPWLLIPAGIYGLVLNVRILQAAQKMNPNASLGVLVLSSIAVMLVFSILVIVILLGVISALLS